MANFTPEGIRYRALLEQADEASDARLAWIDRELRRLLRFLSNEEMDSIMRREAAHDRSRGPGCQGGWDGKWRKWSPPPRP